MRLAIAFLAATVTGRALAQSAEIPDEAGPPPIPSISHELLDPRGMTRFHLVTRASFGDGDQTFSRVAKWAYEARANVRVAQGLSVGATLPFGLSVPGGGETNQFFFGNFSVGIAGGGLVRFGDAGDPVLSIGGALDIYAPTAVEPEPGQTVLLAAQGAVATLHAYEPQLYMSNLMSFRGRGTAGLQVSILRAALELSLTPAFTLESQSELILLFGGAGRVSVLPIRQIEPFLEMGTTIQISGPGEIAPPFSITPGVRFHVFDALDPAIFVSFNFVEPSSIIFGIDLAGALRSNARKGDLDEFLGTFE
jgi:hypothetical protein